MGVKGLAEFLKGFVCLPHQSYSTVYVEVNPILHAALHMSDMVSQAAAEEPHPGTLTPFLCGVLEWLVEQLRPTACLFIATDGPSTAKLVEQRARRSHILAADPLARWRLALTPATKLMRCINEDLRSWAAEFADIHRSLPIIISDSQVAGEGEAKVFGHLIQLARDDPNGPHAVVSPDADIVLWSLASLVEQIHWIRLDHHDNALGLVCYSIPRVIQGLTDSLVPGTSTAQQEEAGSAFGLVTTDPIAIADDVLQFEMHSSRASPLCADCAATVAPVVPAVRALRDHLRPAQPPAQYVATWPEGAWDTVARYCRLKPPRPMPVPSKKPATAKADPGPLREPDPIAAGDAEALLYRMVVELLQQCNSLKQVEGKSTKAATHGTRCQQLCRMLQGTVQNFLHSGEANEEVLGQWRFLLSVLEDSLARSLGPEAMQGVIGGAFRPIRQRLKTVATAPSTVLPVTADTHRTHLKSVKLLTEEFFATHLAALVQSPATQKQAPLLKATAHQVAAVLRRLEQALEEGQPLAVLDTHWTELSLQVPNILHLSATVPVPAPGGLPRSAKLIRAQVEAACGLGLGGPAPAAEPPTTGNTSSPADPQILSPDVGWLADTPSQSSQDTPPTSPSASASSNPPAVRPPPADPTFSCCKATLTVLQDGRVVAQKYCGQLENLSGLGPEKKTPKRLRQMEESAANLRRLLQSLAALVQATVPGVPEDRTAPVDDPAAAVGPMEQPVEPAPLAVVPADSLASLRRIRLDLAFALLLVGTDHLPTLQGISVRNVFRLLHRLYEARPPGQPLPHLLRPSACGRFLLPHLGNLTALVELLPELQNKEVQSSPRREMVLRDALLTEYLYGLTWAINSMAHGTCVDYAYLYPQPRSTVGAFVLSRWLRWRMAGAGAGGPALDHYLEERLLWYVDSNERGRPLDWVDFTGYVLPLQCLDLLAAADHSQAYHLALQCAIQPLRPPEVVHRNGAAPHGIHYVVMVYPDVEAVQETEMYFLPELMNLSTLVTDPTPASSVAATRPADELVPGHMRDTFLESLQLTNIISSYEQQCLQGTLSADNLREEVLQMRRLQLSRSATVARGHQEYPAALALTLGDAALEHHSSDLGSHVTLLSPRSGLGWGVRSRPGPATLRLTYAAPGGGRLRVAVGPQQLEQVWDLAPTNAKFCTSVRYPVVLPGDDTTITLAPHPSSSVPISVTKLHLHICVDPVMCLTLLGR